MPTEKELEQSLFFANRVAKRDKHLRKWARKSGTDCYRVYDRDIPEVPLSLDRYGDAAVLYLYERPYDKPDDEEAAWLELMAGVAASSLNIARTSLIVKTRRRLGVEDQYERTDADTQATGTGSGEARKHAARQRVVRENGLSFIVNIERTNIKFTELNLLPVVGESNLIRFCSAKFNRIICSIIGKR